MPVAARVRETAPKPGPSARQSCAISLWDCGTAAGRALRQRAGVARAPSTHPAHRFPVSSQAPVVESRSPRRQVLVHAVIGGVRSADLLPGDATGSGWPGIGAPGRNRTCDTRFRNRPRLLLVAGDVLT